MTKKKTPEELFEQLARMVKRGFDDTATKSDLITLNRELGGKFQTIADSLEQLQRDMREVKVVLGPLARGIVEHEERLGNLERRIGRVEQKMSLGK